MMTISVAMDAGQAGGEDRDPKGLDAHRRMHPPRKMGAPKEMPIRSRSVKNEAAHQKDDRDDDHVGEDVGEHADRWGNTEQQMAGPS